MIKICNLILLSLATVSTMMIGGLTKGKRPDKEVQNVVDSLGIAIKSAAMTNLAKVGIVDANLDKAPIQVLSYKTQLVAGTNYFVKIRITSFIFHVRIYQPLPLHGSLPKAEFVKLVGPKEEREDLVYFE